MQTLEALQGGGEVRRGFSVEEFFQESFRKHQHLEVYMGVSKNKGTPKWMVYKEHPIKMDDLGVPLFSETSTSVLQLRIFQRFFLAKNHEKTLLCQLQSAWTTWWSRLSPVDSQGAVVSVFGGTWWIYTSWMHDLSSNHSSSFSSWS